MAEIAEYVECCRCGNLILGFYFLTEQASPVHWDCLSTEEQEERTMEVPT